MEPKKQMTYGRVTDSYLALAANHSFDKGYIPRFLDASSSLSVTTRADQTELIE